jgi:outer membrane receptor protein involved in Fe transport
MISLVAAQTGELSFFVMQEGKAMAKQHAIIFKKGEKLVKFGEFISDGDGYIRATMPSGEYQIQLVAKEDDKAQAFVRKNFIIQEGKESQLILSLNKDNTLAFEDAEVPLVAAQENVSTNVKEKGVLSLSLASLEDQKPIAQARIFVKGMDLELATDTKGYAETELPEGMHTLSIIHSDFSSQTIQVQILAKEMTSKTIELSPAAMELEEFVVLAPNVEGSVASVMAEEKNSESIANVIGSEQMSKQGDSNAASALKRVAGITIIGGKSVYVRGLGDRYGATELNGMSLPSPDPLKRTVPLDIFPSGIIGSLQVQKSFSPDISGAFGGGYVNIRTKQQSDEDYAKLSLGMSAHSTTGDSAVSYQGGSSDWSGYDTSYRNFDARLQNILTPQVGNPEPSLAGLSNEELQALTTKREFNRKEESVPYGGSFGIEVAQNLTFDEHEITLLGGYEYKSESELRKYTEYDYILSSNGLQTPTPDNTAINNLYKTTIQHGGMLNLGYNYQNFDAKLTKLYVLNTHDQTRDIAGTFGENNSNEQQNYLEWHERELDINQITIGLDYNLWLENRLELGASYATASEYVPNDIIYDYRKLSTSTDYQFVRNQSKFEFLNRETDDTVLSATLKNKTMLALLSDEDYFEIGASFEEKEREGRVRKLEIQSKINDIATTSSGIDTILHYPDASELRYNLTSQPKDNYNASLNKNGVYFKSLLKPFENFDVTFGVRQEGVVQEVEQFGVEAGYVVINHSKLDFDKTLPSLSMKYTINDSNQIKFAYGTTFVYPDFREFIDAEFIHPEFVAKVAGNPNLIETDITSFDFQYGYYFDAIDNITASVFYKDMQNPIEDVRTFTTSTLDRFSFENSDAATLYGLELSWYKNFAFIAPWLEDVVFSGNYTYITSEVTLTDAQKAKFVTQQRELQGLSPEVINLSLTYQNDARSLNLSYNKMSERLMRVALRNGSVILGLDDYEIPPQLLDFTWIEKFKIDFIEADASMTLKIKNILDDETIWKQGNLTTLKYKTGQSYSLSFGAKF